MASRKQQASAKRQRLVTAAEHCYREHGIVPTTIAMIAERADVPVGNVYYYFKTKDAFASSVIAKKAERFAILSAQWSDLPGLEGLEAFITWSCAKPGNIAKYGCPIQVLVGDLRRAGSPLVKAAQALFDQEQAFVSSCFEVFCEENPDKSARMGGRLMMEIQGMKAYAQASGDAKSLGRMRADLVGRLRAQAR